MFRALQCPSSGARQTVVAASVFRMNVEVEVFSAVVGLLTNRPRLLMRGIVMPETCWAVSVRQSNKFYDWLLHLVGCFIWVIYAGLFVFGTTAPSGPGPPHSRGFQITHNDAPQPVGLLWTSDQLVSETSTWQHTTLTTDKRPRYRWDSNPQSQQANGRRPTP